MTSVAYMWSWPQINSHLLVSNEVAALFEKYRQRSFDVECGGQLFVDTSNTAGLVLVLATPPHINDRAGRTWLELDAQRCKDEIEQANAQGFRLVGYWHTHPQSIPTMSSKDIESFSRFSSLHIHDLPYPLAIIVGNSTSQNGVKAWSIRKEGWLEAIWSRWSLD